MKTNQPDEAQMTRWLDDDLEPAEMAAFEASLDEETRDELDQMKSALPLMGSLLKETFPRSVDVAGPELFMHQLKHRIERAEEGNRQSVAAPAKFFSVDQWWMAAAAITIVAALGFSVVSRNNARKALADARLSQEILVSSYAPDSRVKMDATYNADTDAVVIILDGLKPIPRSEDLVGYRSGDNRPTDVRLAGILNVSSEAYAGINQ